MKVKELAELLKTLDQEKEIRYPATESGECFIYGIEEEEIEGCYYVM